MSHTAGFTYGVFGDTPVDKMYQSLAPLDSPSLQEMINRVAKIPLLYQPGTRWVYSLSVDIQGYLVEKLSGKSLPEFQQEHLFGPLGMKDTAFYVPKEKMSRLAVVYNGGTDGKTLVAEPHPDTINTVPGLASGGGGLWSTSGDYLRFAQMLANGGQLGGVRILAPRTLELMRTNHLSEKLQTGEFGIGMQRMRPGFGFGYDFAVFEDPLKANNPVGKGTFLWDGAAATFFWVDPANDIVFVGMLQRRGAGYPNVQQLARPLTMQALLDASK
jgi:CubicO group peptidase (beta-lactamase class C family)